MEPADDIEQLVKKTRAKTSPPIDEQILSVAQAALESAAPAQPNIWRAIIKSRMTKFAAAAVIIIGLLLGGKYLGSPIDGAGVVYGMVDLPEIVKQAKTIQITGWRYLDDSAIVADNKSERITTNCYIDNRHERLRWNQYGSDKTIDEQIMTQINHNAESVRFYKLSDFQRTVWLRKMHDWNFDRAFMSEEELSEFVKVGHETIEGSEFDIWERITNWWYPSDREIKLRVWLSPTTGRVKRILEWQRGEFTNGKWCVVSEREIKINESLKTGTFEPVFPDTYHMENTKENAPKYQYLLMAFYAGGKRSEIRYVFTLENGSVIMVWSTEIPLSDDNSVTLYETLEPEWSPPTKPVEIMYGLTPRSKPRYDSSDYDVTFDDTSVVYNGRHLAWTSKDGQLYEWAIYVPNKKVNIREVLHRCEIVIGMNPKNRTWKGVERYSLYNNTMVICDDEFDTFVLGAMAELSNNGKAPADITYGGVLQLAQQIRASLTE